MVTIEIYEKALEVYAAILAGSAPLREKEVELQIKLDQIADELKALRNEIVEIEEPRLRLANTVINAYRMPPTGMETINRYKKDIEEFTRIN